MFMYPPFSRVNTIAVFLGTETQSVFDPVIGTTLPTKATLLPRSPYTSE